MIGKPISNDPTTGTTNEQAERQDEDKFIIREPYGIEVMHNAGQNEQQIQILCQKILAVIDGSASGHVSLSEIVRTDPKRDWHKACMRLVKLGVLSMNHPTDDVLNDYYWRHLTKSQQRRARRR